MFVKSQNQNALLNYKFLNESKALADVYCIKNRKLEYIQQLNLAIDIGGDRVAISDQAEYIVSAMYEKKFFVYSRKEGYSYKMYITSKYINSVGLIDGKIYIEFSDESVGIYSINGEKIDEVHLKYFQNDICGNQYLVESTYVKIGKKQIRPVNSMLFNTLLIINEITIVNEKNGRLACYDLNGNLKWEYVRKDPKLLFVGVVYAECINKVLLEVFVKKETKISYIYFIDIDKGVCELEKKLDCLGIEFVEKNSVMIEEDMKVVDVKDLFDV